MNKMINRLAVVILMIQGSLGVAMTPQGKPSPAQMESIASLRAMNSKSQSEMDAAYVLAGLAEIKTRSESTFAPSNPPSSSSSSMPRSPLTVPLAFIPLSVFNPSASAQPGADTSSSSSSSSSSARDVKTKKEKEASGSNSYGKAKKNYTRRRRKVEYTCLDPKCNGKVIRSQPGIESHKRWHKGERRFSCIYCAKRFHNSSSLDAHMNAHKGEKPYACLEEGCNKTFADKNGLNHHTLTHNPGSGEFICTCGKRFETNKGLGAHTYHAHSTGNFPCEHPGCSLSFTNVAQRVNHMRIHNTPAIAPGAGETH